MAFMWPYKVGNDGARYYPGSYVWEGCAVGPGAVILPNSVVYCDVPHNCIMRGNPATFVGLACSCGAELHSERFANLVTMMPAGQQALVPLDPEIVVTCDACGAAQTAGALCEGIVF